MAGAGYKLFNTGDVLTAAQVNTYLNEQTVMVFASSAARTSALSGVLAEGMVSYLQDTNAVEVYNGSAWVGVSGAGDVTEVQAGTGISVASGTGPIPVVTNTMATAIDAEGDLIIGDAADAFQRLAIGSNTHVLTVDTSVDGKIKWAAPSSGGMTLLDSGTLSGASVTTASLSASYQDLRIVFRNIRPATDASFFIFRFNADSNTRYSYSNGNTGVMTFAETYMSFNPAIDNGASTATAVLIVPDYANTATWKQCYWNTLTNNSTTPTSGDINRGTGVYNQTSAISSLTFLMSTGNFTSGDYYVYGVK